MVLRTFVVGGQAGQGVGCSHRAAEDRPPARVHRQRLRRRSVAVESRIKNDVAARRCAAGRRARQHRIGPEDHRVGIGLRARGARHAVVRCRDTTTDDRTASPHSEVTGGQTREGGRCADRAEERDHPARAGRQPGEAKRRGAIHALMERDVPTPDVGERSVARQRERAVVILGAHGSLAGDRHTGAHEHHVSVVRRVEEHRTVDRQRTGEVDPRAARRDQGRGVIELRADAGVDRQVQERRRVADRREQRRVGIDFEVVRAVERTIEIDVAARREGFDDRVPA